MPIQTSQLRTATAAPNLGVNTNSLGANWNGLFTPRPIGAQIASVAANMYGMAINPNLSTGMRIGGAALALGSAFPSMFGNGSAAGSGQAAQPPGGVVQPAAGALSMGQAGMSGMGGAVAGASAGMVTRAGQSVAPLGDLLAQSQPADQAAIQPAMSGMQILGGLTQVIGMGATIGSVVENKVASTVIGAGAGLMAMGPIGGLIGGGIALLSAFNASSQRKQAASEAQRAIKEQLTDLTEHISQIEATAPRRFQLAADQLSRDWARTRNVAAINEQRIAEDRARATLQFGVIMSDLDKDVSMRERDVATQTRSRIGEAAVGYASSGFAEGGSSYFNVSAIEQEGQTAKDRIRLARSREEWRAKFNYDIEMELSKRARENLGLQMEMAKSEYEFNKLKLGMDAEDLAWEVARAKRKGRRLADEYERQGNIARSKSIGALGSLISSTLGQEDRMRELPGQILRTALSM